MKAVFNEKYGPVEKLKFQEIDKPEIDADRVLLRVEAASVNPADLHSVKGGLVVRAGNRFKRGNPVPGTDCAGTVTEVGANVTELHVGDRVFGGCGGSYAEYARARARFVAPLPTGVTPEQAAAIPIAGMTALQGLRDRGNLQPGQSVLINGAAGGVGTFAVQIAKALGGTVTGVCSTRNVDLVQSIGADHVIDYTQEDFAKSGARFDLVFDTVGNRPLSALRAAAKPEGTIVLVGGGHQNGHGHGGLLKPLLFIFRSALAGRFVSQKITFFIANINTADLTYVAELVQSGTVKPVIEREYVLSEAKDALQHLEGAHVRGKLVIRLDPAA